MTVGKAIFDLLLGDTDLRAIVDNRIFPEVAQQDAVLPYVVYNISSNEPSDTKREPSKLDTAQIEVNLYSTSYSECIDMATHVRAALDRVRGTYSGVNVQSIQYLGEIIDFDEAQRTYNITADYDVRISRTDFEIAQGSPITGVTLGELSDVDTTGVTDGQVIAYDADAQEWQPADDAGGVTELGQLDDVQFSQDGPEDGNVLFYDGDTWTNDTLQKSQIGLGNVDNTSDADKPVSSATQTALGAKANSADFSNVDNTSDADKPVSTATQTALNAKADTSAVPTDLNDLSDVSIVGTPEGNQALIYDTTAGAFKSQVSYTNRFEDEVETGLQIPTIFAERGYSVKAEGDGVFLDAESDTPTAGKVIKRKIYHKTGFISDDDVIGDYTLIHTFADDTAYADTVATFDAFEDGATYGVPPFTLFQTWEEVDAAPAFTGLLNETYGSGAEAAYSTRRLNGLYSGDCMTIRKADGTTQSIGFVGEEIDESAIETFCSGSTCTVQVWRDQSGNGNDAEQTTPNLQPTVYTGGALIKKGGRLALEPQGFGGLVVTGLTGQTNTNVFEVVFANQSPVISLDSASGQGKFPYLGWNGSSSGHGRGTNFFVDGTSKTFSTRNDVWQTLNNTQRVVSYTVDTSDYNGFALRYGLNNTTYAPIQQEVVIYPSVKSTSDRTDIEENIGDYFTQNTPLLDTYSGAAAAYSLRLLDSTYTGSAVRVRRASDNTEQDIGFNVFGELLTVALAAFCGSSDGFVKVWYDQAGSNDAEQTTAANQPKIYDGTNGVVTENGKPAISNNNNQMNFTSSITATAHSILGVFRRQSGNGPLIGENSRVFYQFSGQGTYLQPASGASTLHDYFPPNSQTLSVSIRDGVADSNLYVNGTEQSLSSSTLTNQSSTLTKIGYGSNRTFAGSIQEIIIYDSDQSANRTGIETNLNTFYDIYS